MKRAIFILIFSVLFSFVHASQQYYYEGGGVSHILVVEPYANGNYTLNERILIINDNLSTHMVWDVDASGLEATMMSFVSNQNQSVTRDFSLTLNPGGIGSQPFGLDVSVDMKTSSFSLNNAIGPFTIDPMSLSINVGYHKGVLSETMQSQVAFHVNGQTFDFNLSRMIDTYRAYTNPSFDDSYYPTSLDLDLNSSSGSLDFQDYYTNDVKLFEITVGDVLVEFYLTDMFVRSYGNWSGEPIPELCTLSLIAPNGGETFPVGTTKTITWKSEGKVSNIQLSYSPDNGSTWNVIKTVANTGSTTWVILNTPSTECLLMISDADDSDIYDISDAVFTIQPAYPVVTSPNGGENLLAGSIVPIQWETIGVVDDVLIEYSVNKGISWTEVPAPNTGSYDWEIPFIESDQCLIRISDLVNLTLSDTSNSVFTIYRCRNEMAADFDKNCIVNLQDFALFAQEWLGCGNEYDGSCNIDLPKYDGIDLLAEYELGNWNDISSKGAWTKQNHAFRILPSPGSGADFGWTYAIPNGLDTFRVIKRFKMTPIGAIQVVFTENTEIAYGYGVFLSYKWLPGFSVGDLTNRDITTVPLPDFSYDKWHVLVIDVMPEQMIAQLDNQTPIIWNGSFTPTSITISGDEFIDWYIQDLILIPYCYTFYKEHLYSNPGWSITGQWEYAQPLGLGGVSYGNPDPDSGYTGLNVCGINLSGDYNTEVSGPYYLTTGPISCRHFSDVKVSFMSWLNIDSSQYAFCNFEVSANGTNWFTLWNNTPEPTTGNDWNKMEFDISQYADDNPTLYLRWGYQIIDRAYPYSGWNIDDVEVWGNVVRYISLPYEHCWRGEREENNLSIILNNRWL